MREKLIELIGKVQDEGRDYSDVVCSYPTSNERLADYLIANGVTIHDANTNKDTHGHWITCHSGRGKHSTSWVVCSECKVCGFPEWKRCPVCEAKMDLPNITEETNDALKKMGEKVHGE